jgi:hypothetical protein
LNLASYSFIAYAAFEVLCLWRRKRQQRENEWKIGIGYKKKGGRNWANDGSGAGYGRRLFIFILVYIVSTCCCCSFFLYVLMLGLVMSLTVRCLLDRKAGDLQPDYINVLRGYGDHIRYLIYFSFSLLTSHAISE